MHGNAHLSPEDGRFMVLVLASDSEAEREFTQYQGDTSPDDFELRDANLVVIADFSNSSDPLPAATRSQIRAAVKSLREARMSGLWWNRCSARSRAPVCGMFPEATAWQRLVFDAELESGAMACVREGDVFVAREAVEAIGLTHWRSAFTGGFECVIPVGTILVADHDHVEGAQGVGVRPQAYDEMECMLVPEEDRTADGYDGYSLVVLLADLHTKFVAGDTDRASGVIAS
jgi:hypothetical protein